MEMMKVIFEGISSIAVLIAAGSFAFAVSQYRFDVWLRAQEIFTDQRFVQARKKVFERPNDYCGPLDEYDYMVCRRMDELCRLVPYLLSRTILKTWSDPIAKTWRKLENAIYIERKKTGWSNKWDAYERMAKKSLKRLEEICYDTSIDAA